MGSGINLYRTKDITTDALHTFSDQFTFNMNLQLYYTIHQKRFFFLFALLGLKKSKLAMPKTFKWCGQLSKL